MRYEYLVYPRAQEIIKSSGLDERIKKARGKGDGLPYFGGFVSDSDVRGVIDELKERGYFKTFPEDRKKEFQTKMTGAFRDMEENPWEVHRVNDVLKQPAEPEDFYLMTGWISSYILKPKEIWDFERFGFSSLNDFVGSLGATIWSGSKIGLREGYTWTTRMPDGRILEGNIGGDHNLDLRIHQVDITPYRTIDPMGFEVSYRPRFHEEDKCVAAYHSTESSFLIGLLKWIHQNKIPSKMLDDNGKQLAKWTKSIHQRFGAAAEAFDDSPRLPFGLTSKLGDSMPVLDINYSTDEPSHHGLHVAGGEGVYYMYIGPNKELVISYENDMNDKRKDPSVIFQPSEADDLLKGLFYQSMRGLGRTSPLTLIEVVNHFLSQ